MVRTLTIDIIISAPLTLITEALDHVYGSREATKDRLLHAMEAISAATAGLPIGLVFLACLAVADDMQQDMKGSNAAKPRAAS